MCLPPGGKAGREKFLGHKLRIAATAHGFVAAASARALIRRFLALCFVFCLIQREAVLDEPRDRIDGLLGVGAARLKYERDPGFAAQGEHVHDALPVDAKRVANHFDLRLKTHRQACELLRGSDVQPQRILIAYHHSALNDRRRHVILSVQLSAISFQPIRKDRKMFWLKADC
jgi:hypothetical protein